MAYQKANYTKSISYFLIFSILFHLIFFILTLLTHKEKIKNDHPSSFIPAYTYHSNSAVPKAMPSMARKTTPRTSPDAIGLEALPKPAAREEKKSLMTNSLETLQNEFVANATKQKANEPVYLIGDPNYPATGIILLIAKSLSAHFAYPPVAGQLGTQGRVIIGVTLHPKGNFTDIELLESSHSRELDSAALYAVNSAPLVEGADRFLSKPRRFVIGYLFISST